MSREQFRQEIPESLNASKIAYKNKKRYESPQQGIINARKNLSVSKYQKNS